MLRVCKEIRIYSIADLDAEQTEMISDVIEYFKKRYPVEIKETNYRFQKGADRLLVIRK